MRIQLRHQAEELLGKSDLLILTERGDDGALRIGQMVKMGFPEVLDRPIPRPGKQRGLSGGWTAGIWLAYILTAGDHRKGSVDPDSKGLQPTLSPRTGQGIAPLDCSDDRLGHLLHPLSKPHYWHEIERDLHARRMEVDALPQDVLRCDATTVSGAHEVTAGGLGQFGHSHEDPTRPQIKVLMGALAPVGMPLATEVLAGERADDGFDIPVIERIRVGLRTRALRFVGDGKRRALDTRAHIAGPQHVDLSPLPWTGATAEAMDAGMTEGGATGAAGALERMFRTNARGHEVLAAAG